MDQDHEDVDFKTIEAQMLKFTGGEIFISKDYWDEGIAIIYLNHQEKRNALSGKMMVDFRKCIDELEKWKEGKAVLLCGLGENFCSGGDLDFARAATNKDGIDMCYIMQDVLKRFRKLPLITVSLIHGPTLGGGAEVSIFSDYVLVCDNTKLGFVHGKMGLITAFGGTTRLLQLLNERNTMEVLLTSKIYSAEECLNIGLAYKKVNTETRNEEALNFIRQFTVHHYSIIQSYKQITVYAAGESFENILTFERKLFCPTWGGDLNRDALNKHIKHIKR